MKISNTAILAFAAITTTANYVNAFVAPANKVASPTFVDSRAQQGPEALEMLGSIKKIFGAAGKTPTLASEDQIRSLFYLWNSALATGDSRTVAQRYSKDPMLLATVSDQPRTDFRSIKNYFDTFLTFKPQVVILEGKITVGPDWAKDAGIYEFTMGANGQKIKARYSFVYIYEGGGWKILHHHSSVMPERSQKKGPEVTKDEVQGLFHLWNDALATLDSDLVAKRYAKSAVLLPSASDIPRTDYPSIKRYFDNFLQLKPQGKILESFVTIGDGWCNDSGIYEFTVTMGSNVAKVRARYSFVYIFEDGQWKISHHHCSVMPEASAKAAAAGPVISEAEAKKLFSLWNNALATLDPDTVAKRYSKNAVLLPTAYGTPCTNYASIKDYFVNFLKNKPQGKILDSYVVCGNGWCNDVGVYEFTMGADGGSVVKGRYSFVYVYEDGEWKISYHHSSFMPEGILGKKKVEKEELVLA